MNPLLIINVAITVIAASKRDGNIRDKSRSVPPTIATHRPGEMAVLKSADPEPYRKIISGQKDFVEILFFGLEKGRCNCDRIWTQGYGVQIN